MTVKGLKLETLEFKNESSRSNAFLGYTVNSKSKSKKKKRSVQCAKQSICASYYTIQYQFVKCTHVCKLSWNSLFFWVNLSEQRWTEDVCDVYSRFFLNDLSTIKKNKNKKRVWISFLSWWSNAKLDEMTMYKKLCSKWQLMANFGSEEATLTLSHVKLRLMGSFALIL